MSQRRKLIRLALASFALATAGGLLASPAADARRGDERGPSVTACSRYGKGCVTGSTRQGRVEREVRMPGGTWIGCKRDCRETLREESVDFFETLRERAPDRTN